MSKKYASVSEYLDFGPDPAVEALQVELVESRAEARHDVLTGLPNRRAFVEDLKRVGAEVDRRSESAVVICLDLVGLKEWNKGGHEAGDEILREFAGQLKNITRLEEQPYRLGGDEFAVILRTNSESDVAYIKRLEEALQAATKRDLKIQFYAASATIDPRCTSDDPYSGPEWAELSFECAYNNLAAAKGPLK